MAQIQRRNKNLDNFIPRTENAGTLALPFWIRTNFTVGNHYFPTSKANKRANELISIKVRGKSISNVPTFDPPRYQMERERDKTRERKVYEPVFYKARVVHHQLASVWLWKHHKNTPFDSAPKKLTGPGKLYRLLWETRRRCNFIIAVRQIHFYLHFSVLIIRIMPSPRFTVARRLRVAAEKTITIELISFALLRRITRKMNTGYNKSSTAFVQQSTQHTALAKSGLNWFSRHVGK